MTRVLFVNAPPRQCGVYAHGAATCAAMSKSSRLQVRYVEMPEASDARSLIEVVAADVPQVIVYNWHVMTMRWLDDDVLAQVRRQSPRIAHVAVAHDRAPPWPLLSGVVQLDPTIDETFREFRIRRLVPEFTPSQQPADNVIGWFGFAARHKGVDRLIHQVNLEFDDAVLRLHIPFNYYGDRDGELALELAAKCRFLAKPGIRVEVTHDYKTNEELIDWLSANSVNCYMYENIPANDISSAIDYALAARRPIAVSDSNMFRHLIKLCPGVRLTGRSLKEIIRDGFEPLEPVRRDWCEANVMRDYEHIVETVAARAAAVNLTSNRLLTPEDRDALQPQVDELRDLEPKITNRKNAHAVFQNAFVFEQIRQAAGPDDDILLIGGLDDPIGPALQKLGHRVRITDPALDGHNARTLWLESVIKTNRAYDIIAACSVMEHVADDVSFIYYLYHLLKPGGLAFLTTVFYEDPVEHDEEALRNLDMTPRVYDSQRLSDIIKHIPEEALLDVPAWGVSEPYLSNGGKLASVCAISFRKRVNRLRCDLIPEHRFTEQIRFMQQEIDALNARFADVYEAGPTTLRIAGNVDRVLKRVPAMKSGVKKLLRTKPPKKG
jgi:SAM-dependent methyltransferase